MYDKVWAALNPWGVALYHDCPKPALLVDGTWPETNKRRYPWEPISVDMFESLCPKLGKKLRELHEAEEPAIVKVR